MLWVLFLCPQSPPVALLLFPSLLTPLLPLLIPPQPLPCPSPIWSNRAPPPPCLPPSHSEVSLLSARAPLACPPPCIVFIACMTAQVPYPIFPSKAFAARCYSCISIEPIKANLFALISIYFSLVDIRFPFLLLQHDFLFVFLMVYPPLSSSINLVGFTTWFQGLSCLLQPLD